MRRKQSLQKDMSIIALDGQKTALSEARRVLTEEAQALLTLVDAIGVEFKMAVKLILSTEGRLIVTGMGKSGHIGAKLAATFASTGTPSFFLHPSEASHGDLGMITEKDMVLALGHSGESKELIDVVAYCGRFGVPLVAITSKPASTLGSAANIVLNTHVTAEACPVGQAPTTSTTASMALGDALAVALMHERGFSAMDFAKYHPGGKLGAQLQNVADVMLTENLPLVPLSASTQEMLVEMTTQNVGCVGIIDANGALAGIFTDGDLKRKLNKTFLDKTAKDVMSANPKTIKATAMATQGVHMMEEKSISSLFVLGDKGQPIGLFRLQECLSTGIV